MEANGKWSYADALKKGPQGPSRPAPPKDNTEWSRQVDELLGSSGYSHDWADESNQLDLLEHKEAFVKKHKSGSNQL